MPHEEINKMFNCKYNLESNTMFQNHDCGLLSNATVTLFNLLDLHSRTFNSSVNIVWNGQTWNKSDGIKRNTYSLYFDRNLTLSPLQTRSDSLLLNRKREHLFIRRRTHSIHGKLNFNEIIPLKNIYFNLSGEVKEKESYLINKYNISPDKTIVILDRGTDKRKEIPKLPADMYLEPVFKHLSNSYTVLIQTDQLQEFNILKERLTERQYNSFNIKEMPMTTSKTVIHKIPFEKRNNMDNYDLGITYLATVSIISKCKYVVFDTSNASFWAMVFRGNVDNTCQLLARSGAPIIANNFLGV